MAIESYGNKVTKRFHQNGVTPRAWRAVAKIALRRLDMLEAATAIFDLLISSEVSLNRRSDGRQSIQVSGQLSICFVWTLYGAEEVEIVNTL
jgi:toxin HigB-1